MGAVTRAGSSLLRSPLALASRNSAGAATTVSSHRRHAAATPASPAKEISQGSGARGHFWDLSGPGDPPVSLPCLGLGKSFGHPQACFLVFEQALVGASWAACSFAPSHPWLDLREPAGKLIQRVRAWKAVEARSHASPLPVPFSSGFLAGSSAAGWCCAHFPLLVGAGRGLTGGGCLLLSGACQCQKRELSCPCFPLGLTVSRQLSHPPNLCPVHSLSGLPRPRVSVSPSSCSWRTSVSSFAAPTSNEHLETNTQRSNRPSAPPPREPHHTHAHYNCTGRQRRRR